MENNNNISNDDELKAENELLKLKLEMEHGMEHSESNLPPEVENEWLNHIYNYEQQYKNAPKVTVYELIGKPSFRKTEEMNHEELKAELERINAIMEENGVQFSAICDYPDEVLYRFITEELFLEETYVLKIKGMMHCYTYEEFCPNHEYDLKRYTSEYIQKIFSKKWDLKYSIWVMADEIILNGQTIAKEDFSQKVLFFQDLYKSVELISFDIVKIEFDLETDLANVNADAEVELILPDGTKQLLHTNVSLGYKWKYSMWELNEIMFTEFQI